MAEDVANSNSTDGTQTTEQVNGGAEAKGSDSKTFSQEDVDKIVRKRLAEQESKFNANQQDLISKALAERDRQSKMTAEEKASEENQKRQNELEERERSITMRENRVAASEMLAKEGIDTSLVDFVVDLDMNKTQENIKTFKKAYNESVAKTVDSRLSGKAPTDFGDGSKKSGDKSEKTAYVNHTFKSGSTSGF